MWSNEMTVCSRLVTKPSSAVCMRMDFKTRKMQSWGVMKSSVDSENHWSQATCEDKSDGGNSGKLFLKSATVKSGTTKAHDKWQEDPNKESTINSNQRCMLQEVKPER